MIKDLFTKMFPVWDDTKIRVGSLVVGADPKSFNTFQGYVTGVTLTTVTSIGVMFHPDGSVNRVASNWTVSSSDKEDLEVLKF